MFVFPAERPLTTPTLFTLAIVGLAETHALFAAAAPLPVNVRFNPAQTLFPPEIVGFGLTVTVIWVVVAHCPAEGVKV